MFRILISLGISVLLILPFLSFEDEPYFLSIRALDEAEQQAYDYRMLYSIQNAEPIPDRNIVIVDIDKDSINNVGYWPWRRDKLADFIAQINNFYNARLIVLPDSLLEESDQASIILEELKERFYFDNAMIRTIEQIEPEYNFDLRLRRELEGKPIILGYEFDNTQRRLGELPKILDFYNLSNDSGIPPTSLRAKFADWNRYTGYSSSDDEYSSRVYSSGFTNFNIDNDGLIRRYNFISTYNSQGYVSLAAAVLRYFRNPLQPDRIYFSGGIDNDAVFRIGTRDLLTRVDHQANLNLNFFSEGGPDGDVFEYYPAHEIFNGNVSKDALNNKIVFIGSSSDEINDFWSTPVNARMPGIEIHALALKNIMENTAIVRPQYAWLIEGALLVILAVLFSFLFPRLRTILTITISVALVTVLVFVNYNILWLIALEFYRIVPFVVLILGLMITNLFTNFFVEYREKRKVEGVLNQYIPPELAKEVNASKKGFSMEGEIKEMSILFSDVRGFTTISESLEPHDLTQLMNQMLSALSHEIHINRGTIDKYIGDAVMAFWNAPLDDKNHAANSIHGAIGMQAAITELSKELVSKHMPEMKMGVGINTGTACVGNMGSNIRLSYTVMGDTVNLASRLEGITKQYGVSIIVGERTYELTNEIFIFRPVDAVKVKGKNLAVNIFEPLVAAEKAENNHVMLAEESFRYWELYQHRDFSQVVQIIEALMATFPNDGLLKVHYEKAKHFLENPPPDDWEAVTKFDTK